MNPDPKDYYFIDEKQPTEKIAPKEKGLLRQTGEFGVGLVNSAIQGGLNTLALPGALQEYTVGDLPGPLNVLPAIKKGAHKVGRAIEKGIKDVTGIESLDPENLASKALHFTAASLPLALATGGTSALTAGALGADLAGSSALAVSDELGAGPVGNFFAYALGRQGFSASAKAIKSLGKLGAVPGAAKEAAKSNSFTAPRDNFIKKMYKTEEGLGKEINIKNSNMVKKLNALEKEVKGQYTDKYKFSTESRDRVLENIKIAKKKIRPSTKETTTNASKVFKEKQSLNKYYSETKDIENNYLNKMRGIFVDELKDVSEQHPAYGKAYKTADELWQIEKYQNGIVKLTDKFKPKFIDKISENPLTQSALAVLAGAGAGFYKGGFKGAAVGAGVGSIPGIAKGVSDATREVKFFNYLKKSDAGQKVLADMVAIGAKGVKGTITGTLKAQFANSLRTLNKLADKFDEEGSNPDPNDYQFID